MSENEQDNEQDKDQAGEKPAKSRKASEPKAEPVAWQQPDYTGPLDAEQAVWRNANLKRLGDHTTKPASEPKATK